MDLVVQTLSSVCVCVSGKLDEKRAPEADLRSVQQEQQHMDVELYICTTVQHRVSCLCFSIFDDIGDYILSTGSSSKPPKDKERHRERDRERDREREREREEESKARRHSYFEKPRGEEHQVRLTRTDRRFIYSLLSETNCLSSCLSVFRSWRWIQVNNFM